MAGQMLNLPIQEGDSVEFMSRVEAVSAGLCRMSCPTDLIIVRIDNWFGPRWLKFSGKFIGLLGIWKKQLTLPPFTPARVVWQRSARLGRAGTYELTRSEPSLHVAQRSSDNFQRLVSEVPGLPVLVWFSGGSAANERGSLMAYVPNDAGWWTWYVELVDRDGWIVERRKGISSQELTMLESMAVP